MPEFTVSLTHLLAFKDEMSVMREGHSFLDEKRSLLGATLVRELEHFAQRKASLEKQLNVALDALQSATMLRGLEELQCLQTQASAELILETKSQNLLGVQLIEASVNTKAVRRSNDTPEDRVADGFSELISVATSMAATRGNLARLFADYLKTERRARALEEVLIPEVSVQTRHIESALEAQEMEEAVWYHRPER